MKIQRSMPICFPEPARATRGNVRWEIVARDVLFHRSECICLTLFRLARILLNRLFRG